MALRRISFPWLAAIVGLTSVHVSFPAAAEAERSTSCGATYHAALGPIRDKRTKPLADIYGRLRTSDPSLPGRWLFSAALFDKSKKTNAKPKAQKICVETKVIAGRSRCVRSEDAAVAAPVLDAAPTAPPTADEMAALRALTDFVSSRGALPEVSNNGRYNFLVQRVAQDLRLYLGQPAAPSLCAGGPEFVDYYAGQVGPLAKRHAEFKSLANRLDQATAVRLRAAAVGDLADFKTPPVPPSPIAPAAGDPASSTDAPKLDSGLVAVPATAALTRTSPGEPKDVEAYLRMSAREQIEEVSKHLISNDKLSEISAEKSPIAALDLVQKALKAGGATVPVLSASVREGWLLALRSVEARGYAERLLGSYGELEAVILGTAKEIRDVHGQSCGCAD